MDWLKKAAASGPQYCRDKFGLPRPPDHPETQLQLERRRAQLVWDAQLFLGEVFLALRQEVGVAETQKLFMSFAKPLRPLKRGQHGERTPVENRRLLILLDQEPGDTLHERARKVADHCVALHPGRFGNSSAAIVKKIVRLAKARDAKRAPAGE